VLKKDMETGNSDQVKQRYVVILLSDGGPYPWWQAGCGNDWFDWDGSTPEWGGGSCRTPATPPGACGKDGGASLILDDALGYTDPERLKLMGAVLAKAGKECQIIILTCVPERYSNIGEATVVRLG
jgi:hypothetical protein